MPNKNKFNCSINKPFVPEKKQDDKKARNVAIFILLILAFCCFGSVLAIGLTVKDCTTASADELVYEEVSVPEGYPNLFSGSSDTAYAKYISSYTYTNIRPFYDHGDGFFLCNFVDKELALSRSYYTVFSSYVSSVKLVGFEAGIYAEYYGYWGSGLSVKSLMSVALPVPPSKFSFCFKKIDPNAVFPENFTCTFSVGLWQGNFSNSDFASSVYYQSGLLQGQTDGYKLGYDEGYSNGYVSGEGSIANSLGFFQGATVTCGSFLDYSSWDRTFDSFVPCPSSFYVPYYSGFYFKIYGQDIYDQIYPNSQAEEAYDYNVVSFDFGFEGKKLNSYAIFNVVRWISDNDFVSTGEYGSGCTFYFVGGKTLDFGTPDGYFSYIDLTSYLDTPVRRVTFDVSRSDIRFFGLTSNPSYNNAYNSGFSNGKTAGYSEGFSSGKTAGYSNGYSDGVKAAGDYTFLSLLGSVVDAPLQAVSGMLNFNLLGFNMLNFFYALLTCALVIAVIRLIL